MSNAMNEMKPTFNYGQITQEHKDAAEEISNLLDNMGHPLVADLIKNKFEVTAKPKYNIEDHPFVQACKQAGIYVNIQGHITDGSGVDYPVIGLNDDIRLFFKLYDIIKAS